MGAAFSNLIDRLSIGKNGFIMDFLQHIFKLGCILL